MSRIPMTTANALANLFSHSSGRSWSFTPANIYPDLNYLNNNVFNLFLHVDYSKSHITVPLFCRTYVEGEIVRNISNDNDKSTEVNIALFVNGIPSERRTANTIFKVFTEVTLSQRLTKVITSKGEVYYGGYGIILDKNMNPLLLCTLEGEHVDDKVVYNSARIYISPSVFSNDGILEKGIIKTVIPFYLSNGVRVYFYSDSSVINSNFKGGTRYTVPEIVVKDFTDDFFVRPTKPKPSEFTRDKVNDFLLENINDLVSIAGL